MNLVDSTYHILCTNANHGFRVHQEYFSEKRRFTPGICPQDGSPLRIVSAFTETVAEDMQMDLRDGFIRRRLT